MEITGNSRLLCWSSLEIASGVFVIIIFGGGVFTAILSSLELLMLVASAVFSFNPVHELDHITISTRTIKEKCFPDLLSIFFINDYHDYIQIGDFKQ